MSTISKGTAQVQKQGAVGIALRLASVAVAGSLLSGCVAQVAHAVFSPALTAASNASQTPESLGITTSFWRGKSCKDLAVSYDYMADVQRKTAASGDAHMAKVHGWQLDTIQQVRNEQGCLTADGATSTALPATTTVYGYCSASTSEHLYVTPVFTYDDYFTDSGAAESAAFNAMLSSTYGVGGNKGACAMEDTQAKAQAAVERTASLTNLQLSWDTVRLNWTPPTIVKTPKAAAVTASLAPATQPVASPRQATADLGLTLQSPSPELVKALGLEDGKGAWVVSVTPGSPAAKAGLKPMDVILDVAGQVVSVPADVLAIAGKMRAGYQAPLSIWREHSEKSLTLSIPSGLMASAVPAATPAALPVAAPAASPVAAATARLEFCYLYLTSSDYHKDPDVLSPVFRDTSVNTSVQQQMAAMKNFAAKVNRQQPGIWQDFAYNAAQCNTGSGVCFAAVKPVFGPAQSIMLRCFASSAEADMKRSADETADPTATTLAMP